MSFEELARDLRPVLYEYYEALKKYGDLEYCEAIVKADRETGINEKIDRIVRKHLPNARRENYYTTDYDLSLALYELDDKIIEIVMDDFNYMCDLYKLKEVLPEKPSFHILIYHKGHFEKAISI